MRLHRVWPLLAVLLVPATARAHEHKMDLYGAFSAESGSVLVGFHTSLTAPLPTTDRHQIRPLSLVGDLSVHSGSGDSRKSNILTGIRYTFAQRAEQKHLPFVQVLVGAAETKAGAAGDWDGALALGAGVDSIIETRSDWAWGIRTQADYIRHGGTNSARVSAGVVIRFER